MFLATTADQRFWNTNETILFLGKWCQLYQEKKVWSQLDHEVLPNHWNNQSKLIRDAEYLENLYQKTLNSLATQLNQLHDVNYSDKYWKITLGSWLFQFIETFFDRFTSIQKVIELNKETNTWVPAASLELFIPNDLMTFESWAIQDPYNLIMYGWIIKQLNQIPFEIKNSIKVLPSSASFCSHQDSRGRKFIKKLLGLYCNYVPDCFNRIVFFAVPFRPWSLAYLQMSLGQIPYLIGPRLEVSEFPVNLEKRKRIKLTFANNLFENLLGKVLPIQIPKVYIEGYKDLHQRALKAFPKSPSLICTALGLHRHEGFKFWAAWQKEQGVKIIAAQHGGGYGNTRVFSLENYEIDCSDKFISWGWGKQDSSRIIPLPSGQLAKSKQSLRQDPKGNILIAGWERARYLKWMATIPFGQKMEDFLDTHETFVSELQVEIRTLLIIRLPPHDLEWGAERRWAEFDPTLNVCRGGESLYDQLNRCRLFIGTSNCTANLESLTANFPTVLFWKPEYFGLRSSAQHLYDELRNAEILHDSPESAAAKVNKIFHDPLIWWRSSKVQEIRHKFCRQFAWTENNWHLDWKNTLKKISGE
tara:strand:- start:1046 stop:2806 length:1761 start_codon:yes stop_codon:yes gene_type:complete